MFTDTSGPVLRNKKEGGRPFRYKVWKLMVRCGTLETVNLMGDLNTRVSEVTASVVVGEPGIAGVKVGKGGC